VSDTKASSKTAPFEFVIKRTFNAPVKSVWKAWTDPDELIQWWGPNGFTTVSTKIGDLKPDGIFHYCLRSPQGQEMWGRFVYLEIVPDERLVYLNSFSDPDGGVSRHPLHKDWPLQLLSTVTFSEKNGKTTVTIRWVPHEATEIEHETFKKGKDSMQGGWTGTLDQLENYLGRA
jgi:uncharacterized protein YndB with AHSA1/START domain